MQNTQCTKNMQLTSASWPWITMKGVNNSDISQGKEKAPDLGKEYFQLKKYQPLLCSKQYENMQKIHKQN